MDSVVTVLLLVYLAATLRYSGGIYGFLKVFLFAHVLGDFVSDGYWAFTQTNYDALRNISSSVRLQGNFYLLVAVALADVGFLVAQRYLGAKEVVSYHGLEGFSVTKKLGLTLMFIGFAVDLFIASKIGFFYITPFDAVGYYGLYSIANTLIPIGAGAFFGLRVLPAVAVFLLASLFSYSKAQAVISLLLYFVYCAYGYGISALRVAVLRDIFSAKGVAIVMVLITLMAMRVATRDGVEHVGDVAIDDLARNVVLATDARFLGGIHRTYLVATDEVLSSRMDTMGGYYHFQTLYLWIPHALWKDKPPVASQEVYHYIHAVEPYGTSFAINPFGYLMLDYGLFGAWVGMFLLGAALAYVEGKIIAASSRFGRSVDGKSMGGGFVAVWIALAFPLSEAGVPPLILLGGVYFVACAAGFFIYRGICIVNEKWLHLPVRGKKSESADPANL